MKKSHWADVAKMLAKEVLKNVGPARDLLTPKMLEALGAEKVLGVVCNWNINDADTAESIQENASELRREVCKLLNPEAWT